MAVAVTVLGAHVPISVGGVSVLGVGVLAGMWGGRGAAARLGWHRRATMLALVWLAVIVSLTVVPGEEQYSDGLTACLPRNPTDLAEHLHSTGGGPVAIVLNGLLVLPFTAALVAAGARTATAVAVAVALPVTVEVLQSAVPGRVCSVADTAVNVAGALLGAAIAVGVRRRRAAAPHPSVSSRAG